MNPAAPRKRDALGKALQLLEWIVDASYDDRIEKEWGVRELAQELHLPPATAHRTLASLMERGLVQRNPASGQYQIGMEFYRLALKFQSRFVIRNAALPVMQNLVAKCNETAFLGVYDSSRMEMMYVAAVTSSHPVRYVIPINEWIPLHAGAGGLAIMAFLPKEERQAIIKRTGLTPLTDHTITDPEALEDELARTRSRGYAFSRGQRALGAIAIAAPIWGPDGRVMNDLVVSLPESRFEASMESTMAKLVIEHAQEIMEKLGAQAPNRCQS